MPKTIDLNPAQWIWLPVGRTLPNTVALFRREFELSAQDLEGARLWISAESRYRLWVNGERVGFGPAPCDPRELEVDPWHIQTKLKEGRNVIAVEVLYYGHGDGTWPLGKPGFLLRLDTAQRAALLVSDEEWRVEIDRSRPAGQYRRWFLRALQEEIDWTEVSDDWKHAGFDDRKWLRPRQLEIPAYLTPLAAPRYEHLGDIWPAAPDETQTICRRIAPVRESVILTENLVHCERVTWHREPRDWFEFRVRDSFAQTGFIPESSVLPITLPAPASGEGLTLTWALPEGMVGWPILEVSTTHGAELHLIVHEGHDPDYTAWLDTHLFQWSKHRIGPGVTWIEPFDYEAARWIQVHITAEAGAVTIHKVGMRRRETAFPQIPSIPTEDPELRSVFSAAINTLRNSAIEICVDGMGRERQQYAGDGSHQLRFLRSLFGETKLPERFLQTWGRGLTLEGYFLDCWPAYDRLVRISQKQVGATAWGPLLDHGVGFILDCAAHVADTGDKEAVRGIYPNLKRFAECLWTRRSEGLLPVEELGTCNVWMDHLAYRSQREKQCAFNLYVVAALRHGMAALASDQGDDPDQYLRWAKELYESTVNTFWSDHEGCFVNNLPWIGDGEPQIDDRSLATALLYDLNPNGNDERSLALLVDFPDSIGKCYPANEVWRYWALRKHGRVDVLLDDLRTRWAPMRSIRENNTISEFFDPPTDSHLIWSHCAVAPLVVLEELLGIEKGRSF